MIVFVLPMPNELIEADMNSCKLSNFLKFKLLLNVDLILY